MTDRLDYLLSLPPSADDGSTVSHRPIAVALADVIAEPVRWLWPDRIPLGKVTVLDGDPGLGKSTVALDIAARVSTGAAMPDGSDGLDGAVVIMSAEDGPADTIRPRFEAAGGDVTRVQLFAGVLAITESGESEEQFPAIPAHLPVLRALVRSTGAVLVIVDVLMAYLDGAVNSYRDQDVRRALAPLVQLAGEEGCAVVVLRHLTKSPGGSAVYRGGGSIGIVGAARTACIIGLDPGDDEEDPNRRRRVLAIAKSNLAPLAPSLAYRIVPAELAGGITVGRIEWLGTSDHRADELVQPSSPRDEEREDKENFLAELLDGIDVPVKEVEAAAKKHGWALKALRPVFKRMGGRTQKEGGYFGGQQRWVWTLPAEDAAEDSEDAHIQTRASSAPSGHLQSHPFCPVPGCGLTVTANSDRCWRHGEEL